jgi:drug/metabolite transporter (DMT)-like permease
MFDLRLLFVAVVWGINFSVVKFALADFHPLSFTFVRFSLSSLFLFGVMRLRGYSFMIARGDRLALLRLGLLGIALYNIFFMIGLKYTTASHSALFISMSPLVAALLQALSGREILRKRHVLGLFLATAGVVAIIRSHYGPLGFASSFVLGDLLTLCATVLWALYTVTAKPLLERYPAITVTAYSMAGGSVLLLPIAIPQLHGQSWATVSVPSWAALGFSAFISAGIAFSLWYDGVQRIGVTKTMVYHYLMPFVAVLFAALLLHERIGLPQVIGGCAILAGVAMVQSGKGPS